MNDDLFVRKSSLFVVSLASTLDLSEMHFKFNITAADEESPNAATIRIYNLNPDTIRTITGTTPVEFTRVVIQAGYAGNFGVIFDGTIKQFRRGRENATDTYFDILASENDIEYNFGVCSSTLAAGANSTLDIAKAIAAGAGLKLGTLPDKSSLAATGGTLPRGKVLWGMARDHARNLADSMGSTWSISAGKLNITPLKGYLPGEAVVITSKTGMIGIPEQTDQGIKVRVLINPKLKIGGLVQIDNKSINQTFAQSSAQLPGTIAQLPFDKRAGQPQYFADVANDGFYRLFVVEFTGDTRGQEWYADLVCLTVDKSTDTVIAQ